MFDDLFGDSSSLDSSGGDSSSLTSQILGAVTQLGAVGIVAATQPGVNTTNVPYGYGVGPGGTLIPVTRPTSTSSATTLLLFGALVVGAIFLLRK